MRIEGGAERVLRGVDASRLAGDWLEGRDRLLLEAGRLVAEVNGLDLWRRWLWWHR